MINSLTRGFFYPFQGLKLLIGEPTLKKIATIPILINCLVFAALVTVLFFYLPNTIPHLIQNYLPQLMTSWSFLYYLFYFIFFVVGLIISFFCTVIIGTLVASPFNDALSAQTLKLQGTFSRDNAFSVSQVFKDVGFVFKNELQKIFFIVGIYLSLLLFNFVPLIGSGLYVIINPLITFLLLSFEFVDYSFSRDKLSFKQKRRAIFSHFSLFLGFGAGVSCLFLIPGLQLIMIPSSVVGATLLYCKELKT
ncbi:MAG TPA: EI24 domain-containing protein [Bdellovibrionota bacterium]|nr:EI24 domain-containing protein [Bdellovibrionota bacterium]